MLAIESIIWTVPGMAGLLVYNKFLDRSYRQIEGWQYLFATVFFAIPYYVIQELPSDSFFTEGKLSINLEILFYSVCLSAAWGLGVVWIRHRYRKIVASFKKSSTYQSDKISTRSQFHDCCYAWENAFVLITLKSHKVYLGILLGFTKDLGIEPTVRIAPFVSGYRDARQQIDWTFKYPVRDDITDRKIEGIEELGLIIPYKEIVTFSLWSHSEAFTDAPQVES